MVNPLDVLALFEASRRDPVSGVEQIEARLQAAAAARRDPEVAVWRSLLCDVYLLVCSDGARALPIAEELVATEENEGNCRRISLALRLLGDLEGAEYWKYRSRADLEPPH